MKKIQDILFRTAEKQSMFWVVFFLTLCESIFLFIPAEIFMTPPIIARKKSAPMIVLAASLGSFVGAIITYLIGMYLFNSVGTWLIDTFSNIEQFETARKLFFEHGILIIFLSAVTPVPYKIITLCAGFLGYNPVVFLGISSILRTGRFAIAGFLLWRFQKQANEIAKKYFWLLTLAAILVAGMGLFIFGMM
jgi:membrane protein YqaA with SNARE-associated domain